MRSKSWCFLMAVLLLMTVSGCASMPTREKMMSLTQNYELPAKPWEGKALVYVVRPSGGGGLVRFNIFVNDPKQADMEAGFTRGRQYIYFYLSPGTYTLHSVAENTAMGTLTVETDKIYYIQQVPSMGILFARNQLKQLDDVEGKYSLSKCDKGAGELKRTMFP